MGLTKNIKKRFSDMRRRMFFRFAKKAFTHDLSMAEVYSERLKDAQAKSAESIKELTNLSNTQFKELAEHLSEKHREIAEEFKREGEEFSKKRKKIIANLEANLETTYDMQEKAKQIVQASASILFELRSKATERKELLLEIHRRADMLFADIKRLDNLDNRIEDIVSDLRELETLTTNVGSKVLTLTEKPLSQKYMTQGTNIQ